MSDVARQTPYKFLTMKTVEMLWIKFNQHLPTPIHYPFRMSAKEKLMFDENIKQCRNYLEFGLGGSTLRALQKTDAIVHVVESSISWIELMRGYPLIRQTEGKRLFIYHIDIGPVGKWGYPSSLNNTDTASFEKYSADVFNFLDKKSIDLILIDGRFRVACALKSIIECHKSNAKILIHDFTKREEYHVLLKYLTRTHQADSLVLFEIKKYLDLNLVRNEYEKYKIIPH